jgi:hypothetical protein
MRTILCSKEGTFRGSPTVQSGMEPTNHTYHIYLAHDRNARAIRPRYRHLVF